MWRPTVKAVSKQVPANSVTPVPRRAARVSALVRRLDVCLDHQTAPELCENLSQLYQHIVARLELEGIDLEPSGYDEVIAILEKLWDGFQEAERRKDP